MDTRVSDSTEIKPLTKKSAAGENYVRRNDAEEQIKRVLAFNKTRIFKMLDGGFKRGDEDYLLDETIVYLLREAKICDDREMIDKFYSELNGRIWKLLGRFRAKMNAADFEDLGQKVGLSILKKIFDTNSNAADFAQAQFGAFVVSEAKAARKEDLVKIKRDSENLQFAREAGSNEDQNPIENISYATELTPESRLIIENGFRNLEPHHQAVAAMLLDGFQIESKDNKEPTISKKLGVSSRTIRNWIKEMRNALEDYRGEVKR